MPSCIAGMHRSGTSLVARLLSECGLDLGPESELIGADTHNADGYWENRRFVAVNDRILDGLGAGWDTPPSARPGWEREPWLKSLRKSIELAAIELALTEPWGWKDPRSSLTLPFWLRTFRELRVVICLRNPVDVILSLQRRGSMSPALGLNLWLAYNRRVLADVSPDRRVITRYERFFEAPAAELARVCSALGVPSDDAQVDAAAAAVKKELRHHDGAGHDLSEAGLPDEAVELYAQMVEEASGGSPARGGSSKKTRRREPRDPISRRTGSGGLTTAIGLRQAVDAFRADRDAWRGEADRRKQELERAQSELARRREREEALTVEASRLSQESAALSSRLSQVEAELQTTKEALARSGDIILLTEARARRGRRRRALSQFGSWLVPPTPTRLRYVRQFFALRRSSFDGDAYLVRNPDVARAGLHPLLHYIEHGDREGRTATGLPGTGTATDRSAPAVGRDSHRRSGRARLPKFRAPWLRTASQLGSWLLRPTSRRRGFIRQYLALRKSRDFDWNAYLLQNPDVARSGLNPLLHYIEHGEREGRPVVRADGNGTASKRRVAASHQADEIRRRIHPCDGFEEFDPSLATGERRAKVIAFYLPQFHAIPENDEWWGSGFTEWRSVVRGTPRFAGHYQPRIPRDLGFYDLSHGDTLRKQVELARAAGLYGFSFYYYWFNGKRLLERPVEQFLADRSIDFPFCLTWANENWTRRWDGHDGDVLIRQEYDGQDDAALIDDFQRHFDDPRYIRLEGRPLLLIYRLDQVPDARRRVTDWRELWRSRHGEEPLLFLGQGFGSLDPREYGLDGAFEFPPHKVVQDLPPINGELDVVDSSFSGHVVDYEAVVGRSLDEPYPDYTLIKTAVPSWDNDARRQGAGLTLHRSTPRAYEHWLRGLIEGANEHPVFGEKLVFVNAWNEWAEAAYLEPDVHYGSAYLNATARAISRPRAAPEKRKILFVGHDAHPHGAQINVWHMGQTMRSQFGCEIAYLLRSGGSMVSDYEAIGDTRVTNDDPVDTRAFLGQLREKGYVFAVTNTAVSGAVVPFLTEAGFRVISLIHELPGIIEEYNLEPCLEEIFSKSDVIVAPADVVAEGIRGFGSPEEAAKMVIRPQGLYQAIEDSADARERIRRTLGLSGDARIVLNVGFGDIRKGFDIFLQVAKLAAKENPDLHFVWVGNLHRDVERWVDRDIDEALRQRLRLVPHTPDISDYYSAADVFFLSSREDPFPAVVLEAMSVGLPVVAFHGSGGADQLVSAHGALVDRNDARAVVAALGRCARTDDNAARDARRRVIEEEFQFDDYCFDLLRMLDPGLKKVSVVVPNFSYGRYLRERMVTIFTQSYPVFETIVLDDCSQDDSLVRLEHLRSVIDRRFRIVQNKENSGSPFRQWAKGCGLARGDWIWIAEGDDLSRPDFLERLAGSLGDDVAFAFSDSAQIDEAGNPLGETYKWYYRLAAGDLMNTDFRLNGEEFVRSCLADRNLVLNVSSVVWHRKHLARILESLREELGEYRLAGDWYLYAIAALRGKRVHYISEPVNVHRRHRESVTASLDADRHLEEVQRVHARLLKLLGSSDELQVRMETYEAELASQFGLAASAAQTQ